MRTISVDVKSIGDLRGFLNPLFRSFASGTCRELYTLFQKLFAYSANELGFLLSSFADSKTNFYNFQLYFLARTVEFSEFVLQSYSITWWLIFVPLNADLFSFTLCFYALLIVALCVKTLVYCIN